MMKEDLTVQLIIRSNSGCGFESISSNELLYYVNIKGKDIWMSENEFIKMVRNTKIDKLLNYE